MIGLKRKSVSHVDIGATSLIAGLAVLVLSAATAAAGAVGSNVPLENYQIMSDKAVQYGADDSFMEWHGYLNFEVDNKEGSNWNFDNHEFYLNAYTQITDQASVTAEFEYEHTPEKLILPIQAYGTWTFIEDHLAVRTGLFFVPIGIPRAYTLRGNKNNLIRQVSLTHDIIFENWSEVGIELLGSIDVSEGVEAFADISFGNGVRTTARTTTTTRPSPRAPASTSPGSRGSTSMWPVHTRP